MTDKRTRIQNTIAGHSVDRPPIAMWRHFPGDDQRVADLAHSVISFQETYDWDFITIYPASTYPVEDYNIKTEWSGLANGDRTVLYRAIDRSLDWTTLRVHDPERGEMGKMLETARIIGGQLSAQTPVLMTVYSPLAQAERLAGREKLYHHMRTTPDRLHTGLNNLTETTLRFLNALKRTPIDGILYVVEHARFDWTAIAEYDSFGTPYDHKLLAEAAQQWSFNLLQINGDVPMFPLVKDYPVQGINWHTTAKTPDLPQGKSMILGAVCGGLSPHVDLLYSTPTMIRNGIQETLKLTNNRRIIIAAEGPVHLATPLSNLRAARNAVQKQTESSYP